jgi:hypothetical protein
LNRAAGKSSDTSSAKRGAEIVRVEFSPTSEGITHRPASIGRLIGLIFTLAIAGLLFSTRAAITDSMVPVTSLSALNAGDSVAWSKLGSDGTMLSSSFDANSIGSIAVTGALAASGSLVSVVCPASQCSWGSPGSGGFSAADTVIWTSDTGNGGTGPLTLAFGAPVKGVGAFIQADGPSKFTAQIQAFNGGTMLKSFTASSDAGGDAVFLGVLDNTAANITSVVYSLTACTGTCTDFAIDTLFINSTGGGGPTPVATASMVGPSPINFGNVDASGASTSHKVTITNRGTVNAMVGTVSFVGPFSIAGTDGCSGHRVAPKKTCNMMVQFSPLTPTSATGSLSLPYNGVAPVMVGLSGFGTTVSLKAPASMSFSPAAAGSTGAQKLITISNSSKTATVQMDATTNPSGPFIKGSTDTCSGASIKPKGSCKIGIALRPPQGSSKGAALSGTLNLSFSYGLNPGALPTIILSGKVK